MHTKPHKHTITLKGKEDNRSIDKKFKDGKLVNFTKPLTNENHPKIYVLRDNSKVIYVGYTSQSITSRLYKGLKAHGKNGYYGYRWKVKKELELCVFVSKHKFTGEKKHDDDLKLFVEAIEAEVVFMVRQEYNEWPEYQNEIHFNNKSRKSVLKVAEYLYEYIKE